MSPRQYGATVTANVVGGFITHARMWFDVNAPGAWEPFASGQGFEIDVAELSEGNNTVYFQFGGCRYESPVTTLDILLDKTAPVLENLELRGYAADADGTYWVSTNAATLTVDLLANDEHSAVAGVAVIHPDDNTAPALSSLVFDDISAGDGLILDSRQVGLSAGDGAKKIYVYLKDLAGNITEANFGELDLVVDMAPVPGSLVTGKDVGVRHRQSRLRLSRQL